jgi:hypothetical protein
MGYLWMVACQVLMIEASRSATFTPSGSMGLGPANLDDVDIIIGTMTLFAPSCRLMGESLWRSLQTMIADSWMQTRSLRKCADYTEPSTEASYNALLHFFSE